MPATVVQANWSDQKIKELAFVWKQRSQMRMGAVSAKSLWWSFVTEWPGKISHWLMAFRRGTHQFSPMQQFSFPSEVARVWNYLDRMILHLILRVIQPTFKFINFPQLLAFTGPKFD